MRRYLNWINYKVRQKLSFIKKYRPIPPAPQHLHLGCGGRRADGYCNVDITPQDSVDVVDDVSKLSRFPDGYARSIYACHVLEHFSHKQVPEILDRWFRVLMPGGEIRISVPDIDRIVRIYTKNWTHFQTDGNSPWIGLLYGGQLDEYDFHKTGFNFCWMNLLLRNAGFVDIREYPHEPHFIAGLKDASLAHEPFDDFLSLNVCARKPQ